MKTLNNHLILYDADCPMCDLYTSAFVNAGLLPAEGRNAYQQMPANVCSMVDRQRAVNEIALVNQETGEVTYGIQSLFKIVGNAVPVFKPFFNAQPAIWLFSKFYAFISYNRRVVAPASVKTNSQELQPTFSLTYRIVYLLFTWLATGCILTHYVRLMIGLVPQGDSLREYFICGGQIAFQGVVLLFLNREKLWDYLGNMMTVSFGGALVLTIGLGVAKFFAFAPIVYLLFFLLTAGMMLLEHIRRSKLLDLGWVPSATWVFYRIIILVLILIQVI